MKIGQASDLIELNPYPQEDYADYALATLTALSVYVLQEWGLLTTFENIAVVNFRLFPLKFAMVGWPQFPDANRTNRSILQMRPKYRNFATSVTDKGVFLNERGIAEARALLAKLGLPRTKKGVATVLDQTAVRERNRKRPRTVHPDDVVSHLRKSLLFKMYREGEWIDAELIDLVNFLKVYDHTPTKEKRRRFNEYMIAAKAVNDGEALSFLKAVEDKFGYYLSR